MSRQDRGRARRWHLTKPYHVACAALRGPTPPGWTETYDVSMEPEWALDVEYPPFSVVAACSSLEAAQAAIRLLSPCGEP